MVKLTCIMEIVLDPDMLSFSGFKIKCVGNRSSLRVYTWEILIFVTFATFVSLSVPLLQNECSFAALVNRVFSSDQRKGPSIGWVKG